MTEDSGLYPKYAVQKTHDPGNKHSDCNYFVLDLDHDPIAQKAAVFYADLVRHKDPALSTDLYNMVRGIREGVTPNSA